MFEIVIWFAGVLVGIGIGIYIESRKGGRYDCKRHN